MANGNPQVPFTSAAAFIAALPRIGSLLAIDVSPRRLGLAGTDLGRRLVTPLHTVLRRRLAADLTELDRLATSREVVGWVVGWPINMDGRPGAACDRVRSFVSELQRARPLPILLWDERLTSYAAKEAVAEGRDGAPKRGMPIDHLAAAILLEDALRAAGI